MANEMLHNRGQGPEIAGTRTTVYNLLPYFLDPTKTEADIARIYDLTVEQIAVARAYILNNAETGRRLKFMFVKGFKVDSWHS